jgi:hypothetical protein
LARTWLVTLKPPNKSIWGRFCPVWRPTIPQLVRSFHVCYSKTRDSTNVFQAVPSKTCLAKTTKTARPARLQGNQNHKNETIEFRTYHPPTPNSFWQLSPPPLSKLLTPWSRPSPKCVKTKMFKPPTIAKRRSQKLDLKSKSQLAQTRSRTTIFQAPHLQPSLPLRSRSNSIGRRHRKRWKTWRMHRSIVNRKGSIRVSLRLR